MSAGEIIAREMAKRRISQNKLAKLAQISQAGLNSILHGKTSPKENTLQAIADALDIPLSMLLDESSSAPALSKTEKELLTTYRSLTPQGQEYIRQQLEIAKKIYGQPDSVSLMAPGMINE